jgi:hypothetical protein
MQLSAIYGSFKGQLAGLAPFAGAVGDIFVGEGDFGEGRVLDVAFPPPGPLVLPGTTKSTEVRSAKASVEAQVNPEGKPTTYHFEYVDDAT